MKKGILIIVFLTGSLFVTLLPARDLSAQENIGRLFMTPEERRTLDLLRNQEDRTTITVPSLAIEDDRPGSMMEIPTKETFLPSILTSTRSISAQVA
ncbi:MAG: hypothetical protein P8X93_03805 [Gammaproteobacteria bacterium]